MAAKTEAVLEDRSCLDEARDVVVQQEKDDGIVQEGSTVILTKDRIIQPCRMERGRKVKMDRSSFLVDPIIGQPFGTQFELHQGKIRVLQPTTTTSNNEPGQPSTSLAGSDNRHINDDAGKAQLLTQEKIVEMKSTGISGQVIVDSVIENSATFKGKTEFSQRKYINKKQKKHIQVVTVLKCSTRLLCDMYSAKGPNKVLNIRMDSMARMLTIANIHAHSRVIVVETAQGLLLSALLERMGGLGKLIHIFPGDRPVRVALDYSGHIPEESRKILMDFPLNRVNQLSKLHQKHSSTHQSSVAMETQPPVSVPIATVPLMEKEGESREPHTGEEPISIASSETGNGTFGNGDEEQEKVLLDDSLLGEEGSGTDEDLGQLEDEDDDNGDGTPASKRLKTATEQISQEEKLRRRAVREKMFDAAKEELLKGDFDGLLIATRFLPEAIVSALLPFLSPSRPFVVFCQFIDPLTQLAAKLKDTGSVFDLHLSETWLRKYQVLPSRTHPLNNMSGTCGYILAGLTIENCKDE